jgi:FkbM family methyltransferase
LIVRRGVALAQYIWSHPSTREARFRRLLSSAKLEIVTRAGAVPRIRLGDAVMLADRNHDASIRVGHTSPPDWHEMRLWARYLLPGDLFLDVGANVGTYTLWAIQHGAQVLAFEPDAKARRRLQEHLALNSYTAVVIPQAVGADEGTIGMTTGLMSANRISGPGSIPMTTIDSVLGDRRAAGMKIDVEGAERFVLEGAERALADQRIGLIQIEWNGLSWQTLGETRAPIRRLLSKHGYGLFYASDGTLEPVDDPPSHPGCRDVFSAPMGRQVRIN